MKSRDSMMQLLRFKTEEKRKKVADLETMIRDFENMAVDLNRHIEAEHDRTGVRDFNHFAYSTFAKSAAQRRANLLATVEDLKLRLGLARGELEAALDASTKAEAVEDRELARRHTERLELTPAQASRALGRP